MKRQIGLSELLMNRRCFKLVCGAGNEDAGEVEKLVTVYAKAGARYFDLSAREDVILAARHGIARSLPPELQQDCFLNISVGIRGDPHVRKVKIRRELCINCGLCESKCLQDAIKRGNEGFIVQSSRCIGCGACLAICPRAALDSYSTAKPLEVLLPPLIALGIDSIELHAVGEDHEEVVRQWTALSSLFHGILSLCIDRSCLSDHALKNRIEWCLQGREPYSTIIQADGAPMSGCDDFPSTTLQALGTAQIVQRMSFPVFLMLSGGTNSHTGQLAQYFDIHWHGVALGSYARKIVKPWISRQDFYENQELQENSIRLAQDLVSRTLNSSLTRT